MALHSWLSVLIDCVTCLCVPELATLHLHDIIHLDDESSAGKFPELAPYPVDSRSSAASFSVSQVSLKFCLQELNLAPIRVDNFEVSSHIVFFILATGKVSTVMAPAYTRQFKRHNERHAVGHSLSSKSPSSWYLLRSNSSRNPSVTLVGSKEGGIFLKGASV